MEFLKQYEILYKKAKSDLKAAKILLKSFENGDGELDLELIMFHLQQCAEKLLKSLLSYNEYHFTKTHDLEKLYITTKEGGIFIIDDIEKLLPLSEYAVEGRYAIIHDDMDEADKYIEILEKFLNFVESEISYENR